MFDTVLRKEKDLIILKELEYSEILKEFEINHKNFKRLVRYKKEEYLIWVDFEDEIDWKTTDAFDENNKINEKYISKMESLEHAPEVKYLSSNQRQELMAILGEITVLAIINHNVKDIDALVLEAEKYLSNRNTEITRRWSLITSFVLTSCVTALMFFVFSLSPDSNSIFFRARYSLFGAIGALLSIMLKSGKQNYNCESGKALVFLEILSKMVAGIIGSFLLIELYNIDMIFTAFKNKGDSITNLIIIGIIGGFSERLVPSIVSKFENTSAKEELDND